MVSILRIWFLGYCAIWSGTKLITIHINLLPPFMWHQFHLLSLTPIFREHG
jgi:hypothetical protein